MTQNSDNEEDWVEEEHDESGDEESSEWDNEEDDEDDPMRCGRSILWLCQEGQIQLARRRFEALLEKIDKENSGEARQQLKREVFQAGRDKNHALIEILMGGTSDQNAQVLVRAIINFASQYPQEYRRMLMVQPPSHCRTALHWAAWSNADLNDLRALAVGNPDALLIPDKRSHGARTPAEILSHYYRDQSEKFDCLARLSTSWLEHRLRLVVHCSCFRHFVTNGLTPFDKSDCKAAGVKPRAWFALSVIGYLFQREMKPLAMHTLSFLGRNAKSEYKRNSKRRRRNHKRSRNAD